MEQKIDVQAELPPYIYSFPATRDGESWGLSVVRKTPICASTGARPAGEQVFLNAIDVLSGEVIPEPTSLALLGLGGLLFAGRRRCNA